MLIYNSTSEKILYFDTILLRAFVLEFSRTRFLAVFYEENCYKCETTAEMLRAKHFVPGVVPNVRKSIKICYIRTLLCQY